MKCKVKIRFYRITKQGEINEIITSYALNLRKKVSWMTCVCVKRVCVYIHTCRLWQVELNSCMLQQNQMNQMAALSSSVYFNMISIAGRPSFTAKLFTEYTKCFFFHGTSTGKVAK